MGRFPLFLLLVTPVVMSAATMTTTQTYAACTVTNDSVSVGGSVGVSCPQLQLDLPSGYGQWAPVQLLGMIAVGFSEVVFPEWIGEGVDLSFTFNGVSGVHSGVLELRLGRFADFSTGPVVVQSDPQANGRNLGIMFHTYQTPLEERMAAIQPYLAGPTTGQLSLDASLHRPDGGHAAMGAFPITNVELYSFGIWSSEADVPEPVSLGLVLAGLTGLLATKRVCRGA